MIPRYNSDRAANTLVHERPLGFFTTASSLLLPSLPLPLMPMRSGSPGTRPLAIRQRATSILSSSSRTRRAAGPSSPSPPSNENYPTSRHRLRVPNPRGRLIGTHPGLPARCGVLTGEEISIARPNQHQATPILKCGKYGGSESQTRSVTQVPNGESGEAGRGEGEKGLRQPDSESTSERPRIGTLASPLKPGDSGAPWERRMAEADQLARAAKSCASSSCASSSLVEVSRR